MKETEFILLRKNQVKRGCGFSHKAEQFDRFIKAIKEKFI
jgi:hypothetical protein